MQREPLQGRADDSSSKPPDGCPIVDFDHHDPALGADEIWTRYADLASRCPVAWSTAHGGFWLVTGFEEVKGAARDHETFSSAEGHLIPMIGSSRSIPIDFDPPKHTDYRAAIARVLSRERIAELRPLVHDFLTERLGEIATRGSGELVSEVALPLPLMVLTKLVGLSEETVEVLRPMTEEMWDRVAKEDLSRARSEIFALMEGEIVRQGEEGGGGAIAELAASTVGGRPVDFGELTLMLTAFAVAGHETTLHAVGNLFFHLGTEPGIQEQMRADPSLIPLVVEESLRLRAPAHGFARSVTADTALGGIELKAGDKVLLTFAAANRDARRYSEPDSFVPGRDERGHLAFGWGVHQCAGAPLARMEMRALLEVLVRLPEFRLASEAVFSGLEGGHHMGPRKLPVSFLDA
jgi:cytochrome P450